MHKSKHLLYHFIKIGLLYNKAFVADQTDIKNFIKELLVIL